MYKGKVFVYHRCSLHPSVTLSLPFALQMLDLGSGDGGVTRHLAVLYDEVHVTEMSTVSAECNFQFGGRCKVYFIICHYFLPL